MKKISTLCMCLLASLVVQAQGFVFQYQGRNLPDGETVIIAAEEDIFGELSCETNDLLDPNSGLVLKLLRGTSSPVTAVLQITHNSLNAASIQWCMGTECSSMNSLTSLTKRFTMGDSEGVQFDATGIGSEGYLEATLKVTIGLETHQVNIIFVNGDYDGIKEVQSEEMVNGKWSKGKCFDLLGRQMQGRTSSGIRIVREGERIRKVLIK